jgi:hypothetical protein
MEERQTSLYENSPFNLDIRFCKARDNNPKMMRI